MAASPIQEVVYNARGYVLRVVLWPTEIETFVKRYGDFEPDHKFPISRLRELRWISRYGLAVIHADSDFLLFSETPQLEKFCANCRELNPSIVIDEENKTRWIPKSNKKAALLVVAMLILLIVVASYVKRIHFPE